MGRRLSGQFRREELRESGAVWFHGDLAERELLRRIDALHLPGQYVRHGQLLRRRQLIVMSKSYFRPIL